MNNKKTWIIISGVLGFLGVALGAFGAHALKDSLSPEMIETYNTGVMYHLIHAGVITAIAIGGDSRFYKGLFFFTLGIVLFSFSLYLYSTTGIRWIAMITPLGGVGFLVGWVMVVIAGIKNKTL